MTHPDKIREAVSASYTHAVKQTAAQFPMEGGSCCAGQPPESMLATLAGYTKEALAALPEDAVRSSFGCGNPVVLGEIREGDTVLDLGSGAGIDILLAAKLTGPSGRVIGVDMTPEMIARARTNAEAAGLTNVEVREGIIEELPVESGSIDLVLSNCVINLSPEKDRVFAEIHRVLKPGGRFSISDIVAEPMPPWIQEVTMLYSACITGAIPEEAYLQGLRKAGLTDVGVKDRLTYDKEQLAGLLGANEEGASCCCGPGGPGAMPKTEILRMAHELAGRVASLRVVGKKPEGRTPEEKGI